MPDDYALSEEVERDDVDELGDIYDTYVCVDEARVIVEDSDGNVVYDDIPTAPTLEKTRDARVDYNEKTVLHEIGWRTQVYESESLPQFVNVNFGNFTALCLDTDEMEFNESWDGRWEEILLVEA